MKRFTVLAALVAAAISFGAAAVATAQESPTPTATVAPNLCAGPIQRGGEMITVGGRNEISLPGGGNFVISPIIPSTNAYFVCYVEGNARVVISVTTCDEINRENPDDDPGADFVLDLVVDSCEVIATPTPTPTPPSQGSDDDDLVTVTPTPSGGTITPPSTGDAGLK